MVRQPRLVSTVWACSLQCFGVRNIGNKKSKRLFRLAPLIAHLRQRPFSPVALATPGRRGSPAGAAHSKAV